MSDDCIPELEEEIQGSLPVGFSCVARNHTDQVEDDADQQLLWLLDSVDQLLRLRESLSQTLSHGWMELATARYAMAPSCISQPVFSLKPCSAATVVSVSYTEDVTEYEEEAAKTRGRWGCTGSAPQFVLWQTCKGKDRIESDAVERGVTIGLQDSAKPRQRQLSGVSKEKHIKADLSGDLNLKDLGTKRVPHVSGVRSVENTNLKQRSEALAWLGALVSPRPRTAQASFVAALEILVKMATLQSSLLMACSEFTQYRGEE